MPLQGLPAKEALGESLDDTHEPSVGAAWHEEVHRCMAEIDSGAVKPVSAEDVRRGLSAVLECASLPPPKTCVQLLNTTPGSRPQGTN
jgi:hypothetical protein